MPSFPEYRTSVNVVPFYSQFALRDWLVETGHVEIYSLTQIALLEGVATDGTQIIISTDTTKPVAVHFELWGSAPALDDCGAGNRWDEHRVLGIECPSGEMYVDQPSSTVVDLREIFPLRIGAYGVHLYWRGRGTRNSGSQDSDDETREHYLFRMWRSGELSAALAQYGEEDYER